MKNSPLARNSDKKNNKVSPPQPQNSHQNEVSLLIQNSNRKNKNKKVSPVAWNLNQYEK
jgi:hypothetical protein